jgi:ABC-2 type transport system permease protein
MSKATGNKMRLYCTKYRYVLILIGYILCAWLFYWIAGDQMNFQSVSTQQISPEKYTALLQGGDVIEQSFLCPVDTLEAISILPGSLIAPENGQMHLSIKSEGAPLQQMNIAATAFTQGSYGIVKLDKSLEHVGGQSLTLRLELENITQEQGFTLSYGKGLEELRDVIPYEKLDPLVINEIPLDGKLCFILSGKNVLLFGQWYWYGVLGLGILLSLTYFLFQKQVKHGKTNKLLQIFQTVQRYGFLMKQLVVRDFKTKYKRSVLGVLWSFLNPLLTMLVQYVVFSTIFKQDIPNFLLYLLPAVISFSFFTESVGLGLNSIVGNSSLILKVYMPKYIYPVTRVLSSSINLAISLIPLLIMILATGTPFTKALLLLPIGLLFLIVFCMGMSMLLSTSMVFFRDTQFLWTVLSMMWMYMTPIFYPDIIIPVESLTIYRLNPMYQYISFLRTIILEGVSPSPAAYLQCGLTSLLFLCLGILIFKKNQDRFVFYL